MLQTPLKMCSVKLVDCRNLIESREEETTAEQQQQSDEEEQEDVNNHFEVNQYLFIINASLIILMCSDVDHESAGGCGLL